MARGDDAMNDLVQNRLVAVGGTDEVRKFSQKRRVRVRSIGAKQVRARGTRRINDASDAEVGHGVK